MLDGPRGHGAGQCSLAYSQELTMTTENSELDTEN